VQEGRDGGEGMSRDLRVSARLLGSTFVMTYEQGGRLADIALGGSVIACVEVGSYDWNAGRQSVEVSETDLRLALGAWVDEDGATYLREHPHLI
jgi:hypothetical protein